MSAHYCCYCCKVHDSRLACPPYARLADSRRTVAELGTDFTEANDKPPERKFNWLRFECICVEVGAWLLCAAFVAFCIYVGSQLKP
jgi:hypothetical protein